MKVTWLIRDYIDRILGRAPVAMSDDELSSGELMMLAQYGGAFDWLADEPDLYSATDGEDVRSLHRGERDS